MTKRLIYLFFALILFAGYPAVASDSICEKPLRYTVLSNEDSIHDGFLWIATDKKYTIYRKGGDFIIQQKMKKTLWLVRGSSFNPYPNNEIYIDTVYFDNVSESHQKEVIISYSLFGIRPGVGTKSKNLLVIDLNEKVIVLNIASYDYRLDKDENGKVWDYLYEADIEFSHNSMRVTNSEDSDIDNPDIQLDDGVYVRKGHCYLRHPFKKGGTKAAFASP